MFRRSFTALAATAALLCSLPALAGPPVLWHPFNIGNAASLPWSDSPYWWQGNASYDVRRLAADTGALLTPSMPVIVRMETLRRAAVYASLDRAAADQLLTRIRDRVKNAERNGRAATALEWFDVAYLTATLWQIAELTHEPQFRERALRLQGITGLDTAGEALRKALALAPDDPSIAFAAAIITAGRDNEASKAHRLRAQLGMSRDPLLVANIEALH